MGENSGETPQVVRKSDLESLYWNEGLSLPQIAERVGVGTSTIYRWMVKYNISRRNQSEAHIGQPCPRKGMTYEEFYGIEKAREVKRKVSEAKRRLYAKRKIFPWNKGKKGLQKATPEQIEKNRRASVAKWQNPEFRKKTSRAISIALKGKPKSEEHKKHLSQVLRGRRCSPRTEFKRGEVPQETIKKAAEGRRRKFLEDQAYRTEVIERGTKEIRKVNSDPELTKMRMKALHKRPSKPERKILNLIESSNLPFRYVGDGDLIIGKLNPDFVSLHNSKVIEVFGRFYHDPEKSFFDVDWKRQKEGRIAYFKQFGYDCLIIWDDELGDEKGVVERIKSFATATPKLL